MFSSLTSLTGGGGMSASSSASADGDNAFDNAFTYKSGNAGENSGGIDAGTIVLGAVAIAAIYVMGRK